MIEIVTLEELREVRRRLSEQCGNDVHRYAEMLRAMAVNSKAKYITEPLPRETTAIPFQVGDESTPPELPQVPSIAERSA